MMVVILLFFLIILIDLFLINGKYNLLKALLLIVR